MTSPLQPLSTTAATASSDKLRDIVYVEGSVAAARPGSPQAILRRAFERAFNRPAPAGVKVDDTWESLGAGLSGRENSSNGSLMGSPLTPGLRVPQATQFHTPPAPISAAPQTPLLLAPTSQGAISITHGEILISQGQDNLQTSVPLRNLVKVEIDSNGANLTMHTAGLRQRSTVVELMSERSCKNIVAVLTEATKHRVDGPPLEVSWTPTASTTTPHPNNHSDPGMDEVLTGVLTELCEKYPKSEVRDVCDRFFAVSTPPVVLPSPVVDEIELPRADRNTQSVQFITTSGSTVSIDKNVSGDALNFKIAMKPGSEILGITQVVYDGLHRLWFPESPKASVMLPKDETQLTTLSKLREMCISTNIFHNLPISFETKALTVTLVRSGSGTMFGVVTEEDLIVREPAPDSPAASVSLGSCIGWKITHVNSTKVDTKFDLARLSSSSGLQMSLRLAKPDGPTCTVCYRSDRHGEVRKSGFKCKECVGKKSIRRNDTPAASQPQNNSATSTSSSSSSSGKAADSGNNNSSKTISF